MPYRTPPGKSLRARTLAPLAGVLVAVVLLAFGGAAGAVLQGYERLERDMADQALQRAERAVTADLRGLAATASDYATWDDSFAFMAGELPSYIELNFGDETFARHRLDVVLFLRDDGAVAWSRGVDAPGGAAPGWASALRAASGLVATADGPLLVAVAPIHRSAGGGEGRGRLLVGRRMDADEVAGLSEAVGCAVRLGPPDGSPDRQAWVEDGGERVVASTLLAGLDGAPAARLSAELPRTLHAQALASMGWLMAVVVGVSVLVAVAVGWVLERAVFRRVASLSGGVRAIGLTAREGLRVPVDGDDELAELARSVNDMVAALEQSREAAAQIAAAEQASRAKSAFLSNMSHELRTPLTAILGYTELLAESRPAEDAEDIQSIRRAGLHLLALIDNLLDISRIEAGRMPVMRDSVDVRELLGEVSVELAPLAARHANQLIVEGPEPGVVVITDRLRLRQIVMNLLSNALKFTRDGTVTVRARVGTELHLEVVDTGPGMTPDQLDRLFQPYVQATKLVVRQHGGTGLGLALTRELCRLLEGHISVQSQVGRGTTFTVVLPRFARGPRTREWPVVAA